LTDLPTLERRSSADNDEANRSRGTYVTILVIHEVRATEGTIGNVYGQLVQKRVERLKSFVQVMFFLRWSRSSSPYSSGTGPLRNTGTGWNAGVPRTHKGEATRCELL